MSVTIKRSTGFLGMGLRVTVKLNGEKVTKIGYDEKIEVELPADSALLKVSQSGSRSNELDVSDGDIIEITTTKWSYLIWFSIMLSPILLNIFTDSFILPVIVVILLTIMSAFFVDSLNLNILDSKSR